MGDTNQSVCLPAVIDRLRNGLLKSTPGSRRAYGYVGLSPESRMFDAIGPRINDAASSPPVTSLCNRHSRQFRVSRKSPDVSAIAETSINTGSERIFTFCIGK